MTHQPVYAIPLSELGSSDVAKVGGKNASLGEMIQHLEAAGILVPDGFATTAQAYRDHLAATGLDDKIAAQLRSLRNEEQALHETGEAIRHMILDAAFPDDFKEAIVGAYERLAERSGREQPAVAVRSSATAEDLPEASFAGQQESFLNIRGAAALLDACRRCYASLFTDRAISYRENHGFDHMKVALSVGVQTMVRAGNGAAGVMFSIDTETGFPRAVLINAAWGLGETVVQGLVDPDEYLLFKPMLEDHERTPILEKRAGNKARKMVYSDADDEPTQLVDCSAEERDAFVLSDEDILTLARWALIIEKHYDRPMDMEWAKDGDSGELFILQARPETVQSQKQAGVLKTYSLKAKGEQLVTGLSIGDAIAAGKVCKLDSAAQIDQFEDQAVLVTGMTDPDWVPIMKRASAIVTDHGGRTSHAAIVSRELGLPAVVGCGDATQLLENDQEVTVSCAEGDSGFVYAGISDFETEDVSLEDIPETRTRIMLNIANPAAALRWWRLPGDGIGLARMEFIINHGVKIHPLALLQPDRIEDDTARQRIAELTRNWPDGPSYFIDTLAYGIARIAASQHPRPVIVRMSDFKTNEYAELIGGRNFEPREANPMLGWRGASRYYSEEYRDGFALECRAVNKARRDIGLDNIIVMIPFCRTAKEADRVLAVMAENGLKRGEEGLQVYVMCEIPSNVVRAADFAQRFDGFSIGSNDLTQLTLGVDRDSDLLGHLFDEQDEAVKDMITSVINSAHAHNRKVGLCGQAPSDHPEFARFLVTAGIDSISVNPDSFVKVKQQVAQAEHDGG
ncbi:phosphoenolpyruvate synthase [Candidatus Tenderia electrophaga]|jgi:pyruvate,water dikinase|uniref:Phosphoenolpyruvate synthase n=1 Tax=Candidatus Tenderia electrophaga TaxID=1748243 RepID=A0A0S2TFH1_9GAMM|nr:phosphoenolpyruvate synthase [Candidatus Tenderia electrophaga]